jgi:hypothetical protein
MPIAVKNNSGNDHDLASSRARAAVDPWLIRHCVPGSGAIIEVIVCSRRRSAVKKVCRSRHKSS